MQTIAEWAEDLPTLQALYDAGIDYVQGYAVSRPQAPERMLEASSAASFIEDPAIARFVGETIPVSVHRWDRGALL